MKTLALCILTLLLSLSAQASAQVAVVAHASVPEQSMDAPTLLDIYTGAIKTWSGGAPIVLVDLKETTDIKSAFYKFLGMSSSRMKSIWMKNLLAGEGNPPEAIVGENELLKRVAATPGALGYVSLASARKTEGVVILLEIPQGER